MSPTYPTFKPVLELLGSTGILVAAALVILWLVLRVKPRLTRSAVLGVLLAIAVLGPVAGMLLRSPVAFDDAWISRASEAYEGLWQELDRSSLQGAQQLETLDLEVTEPLELFRRLEALTRPQGPTLLILDPTDRPIAWAGDGLLHRIEEGTLPSTGPAMRSGFSAVTLASVRRVGLQRASWRLIAGRSYSSQRLPFPSPSGGRRRDYVWAVLPEGSSLPSAAGAVVIEGRPTMSVLEVPGSPFGGASRTLFLLQLSWFAIGVALFTACGSRRDEKGTNRLDALLSAPAALAVGCFGLAFQLDVLAEGLLLVGLLLVWIAGRARASSRLGRWRWLLPPVSVFLIAWLAYRLEKLAGPVDLAERLAIPSQPSALRLTVFLITCAAFLCLGFRTDPTPRSRSWLGALTIALLTGGVISIEHLWVALVFLALSAAAAGRWATYRGPRPSMLDAAVLVAVAALLGSSVWVVTHHALLGRYLERDITPQLGPPDPAETDLITREVRSHFASLDPERLWPAQARQLDQTDLAYALWTHSPLARSGALSSLAVSIGGRTVSRFQFGIPLTAIGEVDRSPELWQELEIPGWEGSLISGADPLQVGRASTGTIRWAVLPRPGFRFDTQPAAQLAATLVRGNLPGLLPIDRVISPGVFAVYTDRPRPAFGPPSAPSLDVTTLAQPSFQIDASGSTARGWTHPTGSATEVILLSAAGSLASLENVGVQTLGTLLLVGSLLVLFALATGLRWANLADAWERIYRSYSRKLVLAYGSIVLLPLLFVSLALLGVLGDRLLRTREEAGQAAMDAAQQVLGEYVLSLDAGFGVDTALDDALLNWVSRVVQHEVNLYWGSTLYASSSPELFTAGLLPSRIPGEVYAELSLESATRASRVNRASGQQYLELYAPLRVPGVKAQERLFLSIPLLAQQEEVAREIESLRTRAVLVALILLLGLLAVAKRLSMGFTRPLNDLIAGTDAIAAGARSIDLQPSELELASLVQAVNDMAGRISDTRERLLIEKHVVEKVVESITAGVVSLDRAGRVVLRNQVAHELLEVEVGDVLVDFLSDDSRWESLVQFLDRAGSRPSQSAIALQTEEGDESEWTVTWVPVPGEGDPVSLLVVEDVTEVLRGQRLQAWAEMARMIAHEIKNPLTPIRLSAEHMIEVRTNHPQEFEAVFEQCSRNILKQVEALQEISAEFSNYSRIPQLQAVPDDLVDAVREVVDSYLAAPPAGIEVRFESDTSSLHSTFDRRLLGRTIRNLIENAIRVSEGSGVIDVRIERVANEAEISVSDRGPGAEPEVLQRMFDPYFSTHASGTGLGLPISRRIVEAHGGTLTAINREGGGLRVSLRLPLDGAASSGQSVT